MKKTGLPIPDPVRLNFYRFCNLFFPRRCASCRSAIDCMNRDYLCRRCLELLIFIEDPVCDVCGLPLFGEITRRAVCPDCRGSRPSFRKARSAFIFSGSARDMVLRYKYGRETYLSSPLARWMAGVVRRAFDRGALDLIASVPIHPRKSRERGFDQARLLAGRLSRLIGVPLARKVLIRRNYSPSQTRLSRAERRKNIASVFAVKDRDYFKGKRVLLVDDVYTTGATANECSRVLVKAGAAAVDVLTAARAV